MIQRESCMTLAARKNNNNKKNKPYEFQTEVFRLERADLRKSRFPLRQQRRLYAEICIMFLQDQRTFHM